VLRFVAVPRNSLAETPSGTDARACDDEGVALAVKCEDPFAASNRGNGTALPNTKRSVPVSACEVVTAWRRRATRLRLEQAGDTHQGLLENSDYSLCAQQRPNSNNIA
jgi:hypothetical protein